jgi:hypothetical protein
MFVLCRNFYGYCNELCPRHRAAHGCHKVVHWLVDRSAYSVKERPLLLMTPFIR